MRKLLFFLVGLVAASCVSPVPAEAQVNASVAMDKTNSWLRSTNFFRSNLFAGSGMTLTFGTNGSVTFASSGGGSGQPASANLTNWSNVGTNQVVFVTDFQTYTNGIGAAYQPANAVLTNLAGVGNTNLFIFSGTPAGGDLTGTYPNPTLADADLLAWAGTATNQVMRGITNAGNTTYSVIYSSNAPIFALKSFSGSGVTITDQGTNLLFTVSGAGLGDVVGPASATDTAVAVYDGTTGKLLKNSGVTVDGSDVVTMGGLTFKSAFNPAVPTTAIMKVLAANQNFGAKSVEAFAYFLNQAVDPDANDDDSSGWSVGSRWYNTTTDKEFVCIDSSTGAAVWLETTRSYSNFVGDSGAGGAAGLVPAPAAGDAAALKFLKADGTWATPAGSGTVTGITNAGNSSYSLINSSNAPVPAFKSLSAGSNVTLTDQGTNIVVAATGGGSGATFLAVTRGMSSNSTTEASIVTATVTNNTLTTGKTLRVIAHGTYTNASAGAVAITVAVKLGGTTLYSDAAGTVAQSSTPRNWRIEAFVYADSSTSQYMNGLFQLGPNSTADTGLGDAAGTAYLKNALISSLGNTAVDMTSGDKTFEITITQGTASTSAVWITKQATVELLP